MRRTCSIRGDKEMLLRVESCSQFGMAVIRVVWVVRHPVDSMLTLASVEYSVIHCATALQVGRPPRSARGATVLGMIDCLRMHLHCESKALFSKPQIDWACPLCIPRRPKCKASSSA